VVGATAVRAWGTAARAATTLEDGVRDPGRRIVYNGPVLFDLTITFMVVRSFTDKLNESNSIEHQLSVVKRRTERRL
jgi:formate-dependent phosphoribosylglycinamide formyltransferase (GAR transformylase)